MKVCWAFFFFLWKLMIFFRQVLLFLVGNDRNWSSLRCITLNARVYSVTLVVTSTGNGKTPPISLTYPKVQHWSFSFAIWSCSTFPRVRQSSKYKNDKAIGLFCWSILLKLAPIAPQGKISIWFYLDLNCALDAGQLMGPASLFHF